MKKILMFTQRYLFTQYFDKQLPSNFLIRLYKRGHLCLTKHLLNYLYKFCVDKLSLKEQVLLNFH